MPRAVLGEAVAAALEITARVDEEEEEGAP